MRSLVRRGMLGLTTTAVLLGATLTGSPAQAAHPRAESSATWLAGQVAPKGLVVSSFHDGTSWMRYTDHGLSLDFALALQALDVRRGARLRILTSLERDAATYVGAGSSAYAGALGKLLTTVRAEGLDPRTYAGGGLVGRLEGLVVDAGPEDGRAKDTGGADYSNTVGQAWVVRALAGAGSAEAGDTVEFLLKQQCASGAFRLYMESPDFTCATGTVAQRDPSVDATALAVQAMVAARDAGIAGLQDDIDDAVAWLLSRQWGNGSFREDGVANANSTGLAAETLALVGRAGAAGTAAEWLRRHQVRGRLASGGLAREAGAVAFDRAAFRAALAHRITRADRYQWRRATAQAAAGLDALLRAERILVRAPRRAAQGERVPVRVRGLEPGERYTVRRGVAVVAKGWVPADGVVRLTVRMPLRAKNVVVSVVGSRVIRAGSDVVAVR